MADVPEVTIENSFNRTEENILGQIDILDEYSQIYNVNWGEAISARLKVDLQFRLEIQDTIRSRDVDHKSVNPYLELDFRAPKWSLELFGDDNIIFSNEFNAGRKDAIDYSVDIALLPNFFPPLNLEVQQVVDQTEYLTDKTQKKLDADTSFSFYKFFDFTLAWKEGYTDDRLITNEDLESYDWETSLVYNQVLNPSFKVNYMSKWNGGRDDVLSQGIWSSEPNRTLDQNLKFTLISHPNISSDLAMSSLEDYVQMESEGTVTLSTEVDQTLVGLGSLNHGFDLSRQTVEGPSEDTEIKIVGYDVELAGTPSKYADYSIKYTINRTKEDNYIDPTKTKDTASDTFDLSLTSTPNTYVMVETAYTWSVSKETGSPSVSSRLLKMDGTVEGELLDIPNLVFTPNFELGYEKTLGSSEEKKVMNLELGFLYNIDFTQTAVWITETKYSVDYEEGSDTLTGLEFNSDLMLKADVGLWEVNVQETSETAFKSESDEPNVWQHEFAFSVVREITPVIQFSSEYNHNYDAGNNNSDEFSINLNWEFRQYFASLSYSRDRVFESGEDIVHAITAEFSMEF